jgi:hypothetical protein
VALTDVQTKFADGLIGGRFQTGGSDGEVTAWFEHGQDEVLLVCKGAVGPFTALQPVPVEDEEQERRRFAAEALSEQQQAEADRELAERAAAARVAAKVEFTSQLATFAGVDPADEKAMAALQKRLAGV